MDAETEFINEWEMKQVISYQSTFLKYMKFLFILFLFTFRFNVIYAQSERKLVREGNEMYKDKKYSDAEVNYKKSIDLNKKGSVRYQAFFYNLC